MKVELRKVKVGYYSPLSKRVETKMTLKTILDPPDFALLFSSNALKSLHTEAKRPPQWGLQLDFWSLHWATPRPSDDGGAAELSPWPKIQVEISSWARAPPPPRVWKMMMSNDVVVGSKGTGLVGLVDGSHLGLEEVEQWCCSWFPIDQKPLNS